MEELWSSHRHTLFFSSFTFLSNLHFLYLILFSLPISASSSIFADMNISKAEGKRSMNDRMTEEDVGREEEEDEDGEDDNKKKRALTLTPKKGSGGGSSTQPCCQVEKCTVNMSDAKPYHRRHKVCEVHAKAPVVLIAKVQQRFCQQCSRFHDLSEFDDSKRSCRRRLLGHNERRRKSSYDFQGEGSG